MFPKIMGRVVDLIPGMPIIIGNPFACTKCGRIRSDGGIISDEIEGGYINK